MSGMIAIGGAWLGAGFGFGAPPIEDPTLAGPSGSVRLLREHVFDRW